MLHLVLFTLSLLLYLSCGVPQQLQDSIRYGDTEEQVLQKVGKRPNYTYFDKEFTVWQYGNGSFSPLWYLVFESGRVIQRDYGIFERNMYQATRIAVDNAPHYSMDTHDNTPTLHKPTTHELDEHLWFSRLLQKITQAPRTQQMSILERACLTHTFSTQQAALVIPKFSFTSEKKTALRYLIPALQDYDDLEPLYRLFPFTSDKQEIDQLVAESLKRRRQWRGYP